MSVGGASLRIVTLERDHDIGQIVQYALAKTNVPQEQGAKLLTVSNLSKCSATRMNRLAVLVRPVFVAQSTLSANRGVPDALQVRQIKHVRPDRCINCGHHE